jgi:signal transduction histidine kinase
MERRTQPVLGISERLCQVWSWLRSRLIDCLPLVRNWIFPVPFSEPAIERQFLEDFRQAGLQAVATACIVGISVYVVFGALEILYGVSSVAATVRRLVAISLLGGVAYLVLRRPERVLAAYTPLIGASGCIAIVGMVSVMRLLREDAAQTLINPVPVLAILVLYGFGRLPIRVALLVGSIGGVVSMFGSRLTNMHEPAIRTMIYLVVANGLGVLLARSIEIRERHLFQQARLLQTAHAQLAERTAAAEKASAEKTQLMAAVSHDLRQPMLSATIHAEVLLQRLHAGEARGAKLQADQVLRSVKALGDTLEHLLMAARFHGGTEVFHKSWVPISTVLERVDDLFRAAAEEKGLELRVRFPRSDFEIRTDEQVIVRAVSNLVSNAIKFTEPVRGGGGGVVVRCVLRKGECRIVVADTGCGIPSTDLPKVWEPYFRVSRGFKTRQAGEGLGLYLVRQSILNLEGHSISVRSRLGFGTRFTLAIGNVRPVTENAAVSGEPSQRREPRGHCGLDGKLLLLVEDDSNVRLAIETQLAAWGASCVSGSCLSEVVEGLESPRVRGLPAHAILADYRLGDCDNGVDAIEAIRQRLEADLPAVLISGEIDTELLCSRLPANTELLIKPFDGAELLACLDSATHTRAIH